jgi:hypothetical protein
MAALTDQPPRSRRFIKLYLATWALLAVGALAYLGLLTVQPRENPAPHRQVAEAEPGQAIRALAKTTVEMDHMRRSLSKVQEDVVNLKTGATAREANDKAVDTRLTAVEERLANLEVASESADRAPPPKAKTSERHQRTSPEGRTVARVINGPKSDAPPSAKDDGPPVPLETGSIRPKAEITFGEPVVKRAGAIAFAVQLAAGPSLPGLRQSWGQLRERHGALATLEPRVVAPRTEGGPYRLLAGPFATRADADRVCTEMNVGRNGCYVTTYIGTPL